MILLLLAVTVLAALAAAAARSPALRRRLGLREPDAARPAPVDLPSPEYAEEVRRHLAALTPLERGTLAHLARQGLRDFRADKTSPVIRSLVRKHLISPRGSDVWPDDAYPFVIPAPVWAELTGGRAQHEGPTRPS